MQSLSYTSGAFVATPMTRCGARARPGLVVPAETVTVEAQSGTRSWRLRRGCGMTFEVYDARGAYIGQLVAPSTPAAPFGGDTVYLDRAHLAVLRG